MEEKRKGDRGGERRGKGAHEGGIWSVFVAMSGSL